MSTAMYIVKRPITKVIHTIKVDDKPTIVGFANIRQAKTYARLMMDMSPLTSVARRRAKFQVERVDMPAFIKKCNTTSLDVIVYASDNNYITYTACDHDNNDVRKCLETMYNGDD
jgi:hypothetical protein